MALVAPVRQQQRPGYHKRLFMTSTFRGSLRAMGWPRSRPGKPTTYQQSIRDRLKAIVKHMRFTHPREIVPLWEALVRHNKSVRGLTGAAATRFRDLEVMRYSGHLYRFELPDGRTMVSVAVEQDLSDQLDHISDVPGTILARGATRWKGEHPPPE